MGFANYGSPLWRKIEAKAAAKATTMTVVEKTEQRIDNDRCWRVEEAKQEAKQKRKRQRFMQPGERIIYEVAAAHALHPRVLVCNRKFKRYMPARREAAWRLYCETSLSTTQIGKLMGKRDHTSIIHYLEGYMAVNGIAERPAHRVKG